MLGALLELLDETLLEELLDVLAADEDDESLGADEALWSLPAASSPPPPPQPVKTSVNAHRRVSNRLGRVDMFVFA